MTTFEDFYGQPAGPLEDLLTKEVVLLQKWGSSSPQNKSGLARKTITQLCS
jgi:hypothetical protein